MQAGKLGPGQRLCPGQNRCGLHDASTLQGLASYLYVGRRLDGGGAPVNDSVHQHLDRVAVCEKVDDLKCVLHDTHLHNSQSHGWQPRRWATKAIA